MCAVNEQQLKPEETDGLVIKILKECDKSPDKTFKDLQSKVFNTKNHQSLPSEITYTLCVYWYKCLITYLLCKICDVLKHFVSI